MATDPIAWARFDEVYARARDPLARYLARRCAPDQVEDLFQEVMTVAWRRVADIPDGDEVPWLIGVARRTLGNHRRTVGRFGRLLEKLHLAHEATAAADTPRLGPDADLVEALASLAPADAEVLRLWAWDELAPREIALALGISANAASIRLFHAKGRLRVALDGAGRRSNQDMPLRKDARPIGHVVGVEHEEAN